MARYSEAVVQEMERLYSQGMSKQRIGQIYGVHESTVSRWLSGDAPQAAYASGGGAFTGKGKPVTGGITRRQLEAVQRRIRVGSKITVRTLKCGGVDSVGNHTGVLRRATVIDNRHPRFCVVELPGGVREAVLWVELAQRGRKG